MRVEELLKGGQMEPEKERIKQAIRDQLAIDVKKITQENGL